MVDHDLILTKASLVKNHIHRVRRKSGIDLESFLKDLDIQDVILFNIQMAVQNCVDIAAHIISEEGWGVPGSSSEMFYMLQEHDYFDRSVSEKMIKAVGFRNIIVHEYGKMDLKQVYKIAQSDIKDLEEFLKEIITKINL